MFKQFIRWARSSRPHDSVIAELLEPRQLLSGISFGGQYPITSAIVNGSMGSSLATTDLNHDGKPDSVVWDPGENVVQVLLGNGDGTFQSPRSFTAGGDSTGGGNLAVADVNRDGNVDVLVAIRSFT